MLRCLSFILRLCLVCCWYLSFTKAEPQRCNESEQTGILASAERCSSFPEGRLSHQGHSSTDDPVCCPVFQNDPTCGRISQYDGTFSFDSRETQLDQFPWAAVIQFRRTAKIVCSGSLISDQFVLSAAHCFVDTRRTKRAASDYLVRLGEWDLHQDEDCTYVYGRLVCNQNQPVDLLVEAIINHESFRQQHRDFLHDIALLKLAKRVDYSTQVSPACLPSWSTEVPNIVGQNFTATGWGRTRAFLSERRKIKLEMIGRNVSVCAQAYGLTAPEVPRTHLCVGGEYRRDLCYGDSGGALMKRESDRWVVVGIVSFGSARCGTPLPGVYTNVALYIDWIQWSISKALS